MSHDICHCTGQGCPNKDSCGRVHEGEGGMLWSWFATPPVDSEGNCDHYWDKNAKTKRLTRAEMQEHLRVAAVLDCLHTKRGQQASSEPDRCSQT